MTKMRELAQKATPDLWAESYTTKDGKVEIVFSESYRTNAAFIAACSPERILAYEDCVEALRDDVAAEEAARVEWNKILPQIPWTKDHAVIRRLERKKASLAALDALEEP